MHIKKITLHNFKNLKDFEQEFSGSVYLVTGENERGKSSILQAVAMALTGEKNPEVLTKGEKNGYIKAVVGDDGKEYEISLNYSEDNPNGILQVKTAEGVLSKPQTAIKNLFKFEDFDAVEFASWSNTAEGRREQVKAVKKVMPKDAVEKIKNLDVEIQKIYNERTEANAEVNTIKKWRERSAQALPPNFEDYTEKKQSDSLIAEMNDAQAQAERYRVAKERKAEREKELENIPVLLANEDAKAEKENERLKAKFQEAETDYEKRLAELKADFESRKAAIMRDTDNVIIDRDARKEEIEAQRKDIETRLKNCNDFIAEYEAKGLQDRDFNKELSEIEQHNAKVKAVQEYKRYDAQYTDAVAEADRLNKKITDLRAEKAQIINDAKLPVSGLSFTDDGLTLNGISFANDSVSDSQKIEVAVALAIASNPTTKVIRISRGESLGGKKLQTICQVAKMRGYQGFIEEVRRGQDDLIIEEYTEK